MKLSALLIALIVLASIGCSAIPVKVRQAAHKTTHVIRQYTILQESKCSATAIGKHALLTASHCEQATNDISVDGKDAEIVGLFRDGLDHTIFLVSGVEFSDTAPLADTISFGDEVFLFGNPADFTDVYRQGTFSAMSNINKAAALLFDLNCYPGDSGAGIFNEKGEIISTVMAVHTDKDDDVVLKFTLAYPLGFSAATIKKAREF